MGQIDILAFMIYSNEKKQYYLFDMLSLIYKLYLIKRNQETNQNWTSFDKITVLKH